jgi:hypothetical protein
MESQRTFTSGTASLFYSEVIKWKQLASKFWSIFIVFSLVLFHSVTIQQTSYLDFRGILIGFFLNLISFQFWAYFLLICLFFWLTFSFNDRLFRVSPKVYSSNYDKLFQILCSSQFASLVVNVTASIAISLLLLQFYKQENVLNIFYITVFCAFSTTIMRLKFIFNENFLLNWPIIEQTKYARFKAKFYNVILYTLKSVFSHLFVWQFIYLIGGTFLSFSKSNDQQNYSTFQTIAISLKLAFIINFTYLINWNLLEIYLTEIFHFPLQQTTPNELTLPVAMSLTDHPYIQHLALIQLNYLSIYSKQGRKSLFSLNFKNGQPTNWIKVSNEALNNIKCFMDIFNFDDMLHGSGKLNVAFEPISNNTKFPNFSLKRNSVMSPIQSPLTSPIRQVNKFAFDEKNYPKSPQSSGLNVTKSKILDSFIFKEIVENLKKKKFFHIIYNENLNYKTEQLFIDSFLIINTLKALSNLAIASYSEDEYGIVQQTLPDIITSFVNLQKTVEKFTSSNTNTCISFKILQKKDPGHIQLLMQKLSFILNESIFKITQTFGTTLKSLGLNEEINKRLEKFYLIN